MPVAAAVAVLLGVLLTGAFHEDGLADTADAVAGGWTRRAAAGDPRGPAPRQLRRRRAVRLDRAARSSPSASARPGRRVRRPRRRPHARSRRRGRHDGRWRPSARADGLGADVRSLGRPGSSARRWLVAVVIAAAATGWWAGPLALAAAVGRRRRRPRRRTARSAASPATCSAPSSRSASASCSSSSPGWRPATTCGGPDTLGAHGPLVAEERARRVRLRRPRPRRPGGLGRRAQLHRPHPPAGDEGRRPGDLLPLQRQAAGRRRDLQDRQDRRAGSDAVRSRRASTTTPVRSPRTRGGTGSPSLPSGRSSGSCRSTCCARCPSSSTASCSPGGNRLSVIPLSDEEFDAIVRAGGNRPHRRPA